MSGARDIVTVRAIDGINLEINDGDRIGLIGHNGSGKTTLLRVLAGIYKPNGGTITIEGRVGALLHPNAGMDPESTGIENIYLRGYMLGMSRREITAKLDDIAEFTELGDFLELPMRTYSAGMFARLAFAVSTAAHNDILLIDEGLGAGDAEFQKKVQPADREHFRPHAYHYPRQPFGCDDRGVLQSPCADGTWRRSRASVSAGADNFVWSVQAMAKKLVAD